MKTMLDKGLPAANLCRFSAWKGQFLYGGNDFFVLYDKNCIVNFAILAEK